MQGALGPTGGTRPEFRLCKRWHRPSDQSPQVHVRMLTLGPHLVLPNQTVCGWHCLEPAFQTNLEVAKYTE